jgi:hypothetical protein
MTVEHSTSGQAIEPMSALCVASRFLCDCASGSSVHGIVMLFMDLHIFTKLCLDVLVIVNLHSGYQFSGFDVPGNAIFLWEDVQPEVACAHDLDHQHSW